MIQLPAYAPDLNPVEGAWPVMKNSLGFNPLSAASQSVAVPNGTGQHLRARYRAL